ncbi:MAG TPA: beta-propeller fold lactonase family protein [Streptosporangiaceae bacterium]|nr:beta-propeller fold lactonase family protein [Streptosporangiaceae bacterium]
MHGLTRRAISIALSGAAAGGLVLAGAVSASAAPLLAGRGAHGFVYTSTNSAAGNQILAFARSSDGVLTPAGTYNTGGTGTAANYGQGAVTLSADHQTLLVVDAGSNQVSDFAVLPDGALRLRNVVSSGGTTPTSVAIRGGLAVVLNSAGTANVTAFFATPAGLLAIPGGSQPLSAGASGPEDVAISPDGRHVVVTEKLSDTIDTFAVGLIGTLAPAVTSASDSPLSFAGVFTPAGELLVADDGAAGTSAVSPYRIAPSGTLKATQAAVPDGQTAACWITLGQNGNVFVDNAGTQIISTYHLSLFGLVTLTGNFSPGTGVTPLDNSVSSDGQNLYAFEAVSASDQLGEFTIGANGALTSVGTQALPTGSEGVAAS